MMGEGQNRIAKELKSNYEQLKVSNKKKSLGNLQVLLGPIPTVKEPCPDFNNPLKQVVRQRVKQYVIEKLGDSSEVKRILRETKIREENHHDYLT